MNRARKGITGLLCLVLCMTFIPMEAKAAGGGRAGEVVDGTLLTDDMETEGVYRSVLRGVYLDGGRISLGNAGSGLVTMAGQTFCFRTSDRVECNLYLQRLVGNNWTSVTERYATSYNTTHVYYETMIAVSKGYYYRLLGGHSAIKGSTHESVSSSTSSVYIK